MYRFSGCELEIAEIRSRTNATITCIIDLCCLTCSEFHIVLAERRDNFAWRISLVSVLHLSRHPSYPLVPDRIEVSRRILILLLSETS